MATSRKKTTPIQIKDRLRIISSRSITLINEITLFENSPMNISVSFFNDLMDRVPKFKSLVDNGTVKIMEM